MLFLSYPSPLLCSLVQCSTCHMFYLLLAFLNYFFVLSSLLLFLSTFLSSLFTIYLSFNYATFLLLSHSFHTIIFINHNRGEFIEGTTNRLVTIAGAPDCAQTAHHLITQKLHQVSYHTHQCRYFIYTFITFSLLLFTFFSLYQFSMVYNLLDQMNAFIVGRN